MSAPAPVELTADKAIGDIVAILKTRIAEGVTDAQARAMAEYALNNIVPETLESHGLVRERKLWNIARKTGANRDMIKVFLEGGKLGAIQAVIHGISPTSSPRVRAEALMEAAELAGGEIHASAFAAIFNTKP